MKYRKIVLGLLAVIIVSIMALHVYAEDKMILIDDGKGCWHGGIDDETNTVYSKIWDQTLDHRVYKATVWVKDATGGGDEKTGTTDGLNALGEVKVVCEAKYSLFSKNKAGYKNLSVVDLNARQAYLRDTTAPSSFEAEFAFADPAAKR